MTRTAIPAMFATGASGEPFTAAQRKGKPTLTPATIDQFVLVFEARTCGRCGGDGRWKGYALSGCCFACNGAGASYTKSGAAALARFRHLCEQLAVRAEDLRAGDRVWDRLHGANAWATVEEIDNDHTPGSFTVGAAGDRITVPYTASVRITISHPAGRYTSHTYAGLTNLPATMPRWDAEKVAAMVNEVAAMAGATIESGPEIPDSGEGE